MAKYLIPSEIFYCKKPLLNFPSLEQTFFAPEKNDTFSVGFINTPMSGFILNKDKENSDNFFRLSNAPYITHPLGFDFEISFDNVLEILQSCSIINGVIQGNLLLCFQGKNLVLIPEKIVLQYNPNNKPKFSIEKIINPIIGATYESPSAMVYLGYFDINEISTEISESFSGIGNTGKEILFSQTKKKQHVFYLIEQNQFHLTKNFNFNCCINKEYYYKTPHLINTFNILKDLQLKLSFEEVFDVKKSLKSFLLDNSSTYMNKSPQYHNSAFLQLVSKFFTGLHYFFKEKTQYAQIVFAQTMFESTLVLDKYINNITPSGYELFQFSRYNSNQHLVGKFVELDFVNLEQTIDDFITQLFAKLDENSFYRISLAQNDKFSLNMTHFCPKYLTHYFYLNEEFPSLDFSIKE